MSDIRQWLEELGFGKYAGAFEREEVDLDALPHLTSEILKDIGVPAGPRAKLLAAIRAQKQEDSSASTPVSDEPPARKEAPVTAHEAERRQITVMFCDLVGSTALSEALDPEDLRSVMQAYQQAAGTVIERYQGHVAQYLGDGLMTYFGWPQAHEDDAERAVRAGLEIIDAVKTVTAPEPLQVRVGIATGPVVVGETGAGDASVPKLAVGETPNLAARAQGLAGPDEMIIADSSHRLTASAFTYDDLGEQTFKGIVNPVHVWRVMGVADNEGRLEARGGTLTPLVGREEEVGLLLERWERAKDGEGQVVLLSGEPGIGKSRITQLLRERIAEAPHVRVRYHCSPYYTNTAFYPVVEQLKRAAGFARDDSDETRLDKLEVLLAQASDTVGEVGPLIAPLLSLPVDRYSDLGLSPAKQKERTIEALCDQLLGLARSDPALFLIEDVHWCDPTTLQLLSDAIGRITEARVLMVITFRPEFVPTWTGLGHLTLHTLNRFGRRNAVDLVAQVTGGKSLPDEVLDQIIAKTDGVPLFVEELTKTVIEAGFLTDAGDHYRLDGPLPSLAIPTTLRDSLMARLDRLAPIREIAQICACIGRTFPYELLAAVSGSSKADLTAALDQLVANELMFARGEPPEATYTFKHALVQDAAYDSLLKSSRQQHHERIAAVLESEFPDRAEEDPELLAHHHTEAGAVEQAVEYWRKAGQRAMRRSALIEAERHLRQGLAVLATAPESAARNRTEISLQNTLGVCLMPTRGFGNPEVDEAFSRAALVSEQESDTRGLFVALRGKGQYQMISGDLATARDQAGNILGLADDLDDPGILIEAHHLGWSAFAFTGDLAAAREHAEAGIALYQAERDHPLTYIYSGHDPGVCCRSFGSLALWQLGFPDQALAQCRAGDALAQELAHPFSITIAMWATGILSMLRREANALREAGETMIAHCTDKGFPPFIPMGQIYVGGAKAAEAALDDAIAEMKQGIAGVRASGTQYTLPTFYAWLADVCVAAGRLDEGHAALNEGLEMSRANADKFCLPEFHRIRAELLRKQPAADQNNAEDCFLQAIDEARGMEARSLDDLLVPVYNWFTEGFDTHDLKEAKALLEELK
jgi:class 3 adenylate cyclase/predicted ATPase